MDIGTQMLQTGCVDAQSGGSHYIHEVLRMWKERFGNIACLKNGMPVLFVLLPCSLCLLSTRGGFMTIAVA